jgi:Mg-chelatase subunit ChlD
VPTAANQTATQEASFGANTNVMIVLDISGSMGESANFGGYDRLQAAKQAVLELLEQYDALGNVMVSLVTFSSSATIQTPSWVSIADARSIIIGLNDGGATNYEDALVDAMAAFAGAGKLPNAQNVSYFLSDGEPNTPTPAASTAPSSATGSISSTAATTAALIVRTSGLMPWAWAPA